MITAQHVDRKEALRVAESTVAEAMKRSGRPVAVAVVDNDGNLVHFSRMDGTPPLICRIATNKAYTAALVGIDTAAFQKRENDAER